MAPTLATIITQVVSEDMRRWKPPHPDDKADIVVSELLGSFGDNELSPECLDGAQVVGWCGCCKRH